MKNLKFEPSLTWYQSEKENYKNTEEAISNFNQYYLNCSTAHASSIVRDDIKLLVPSMRPQRRFTIYCTNVLICALRCARKQVCDDGRLLYRVRTDDRP